MCGIYGFYSKNAGSKLIDSLTSVQKLLSHRGPDSNGIFQKDDSGLAVLRLSIVDVDGSQQPLFNEDNSIVTIYNGMIYNYKDLRADLQSKGHIFKTDGDGEVILHLYEDRGVDCFKDLNGMFAIALYDLNKKKLLLARDHIGIKPLFFYRHNDSIVFSSEIKSFIKTGIAETDIDCESLGLYLSSNYIPGSRTIYKDIYKLLPGHFLETGENLRPRVKRFWSLNNKEKFSKSLLSFNAIEEDLDRLLKDSIDEHMQSDVEVGCFLSGGLDSSSLVHLLYEKGYTNIKTFSVGYNNKSYDELKYARIVVKKYGTDHREIICSPKDVIDFLESLNEIGDSLIADQSNVSTFMLSKLASGFVKVCLSGEGADELFLGYPTYQADFLYPFLAKLPSSCLSLGEKMVSSFPSSDEKLSFDYKAIRFLQGLRLKDPLRAHALWRVIFSEEEKKDLIKIPYLDCIRNVDIKGAYFDGLSNNYTAAELCADADLSTWLSCNNLLKTDIFSMRNSLEVRVPFLYLPLVEYIQKLPFKYRFSILTSKHLLKRVMKNRISPAILKRKKQGWHMPLSPWLKKDLFDYTYDIFNSNHRLFDSFLSQRYCIEMLLRHKNKQENNSFKIWGILVLLRQIKG